MGQIRYYKYAVFLSYSRQDYHAMQQVHHYLTVIEGLTVWMDERQIIPGTPSWKAAIEKAIRESACMVILLSPDALQSKWVREELDFAQSQNMRIFPVLVRGDESNAVPFGLITAQRIDMRTGLSQLPLLVNAIRKLLGLPRPGIKPQPGRPSQAPQPVRRPKRREPPLALGIAIIIILALLLLGFSTGLPALSFDGLSPGFTLPAGANRSASYTQGTLRVVSQQANVDWRDVRVGGAAPVQPPLPGVNFFALELEFECRVSECRVPPEATLMLMYQDGLTPIYPYPGATLSSGQEMEAVGYGGKTRGWVIFPVWHEPHTLLINPRTTGQGQQDQRRIALR